MMIMNAKDTFTPDYVFSYYNSIYGKMPAVQTDLATVEKFLEKFGHIYPNDIDMTCDLLKDYILSRKGMY